MNNCDPLITKAEGSRLIPADHRASCPSKLLRKAGKVGNKRINDKNGIFLEFWDLLES